jgi:hypothetical protein
MRFITFAAGVVLTLALVISAFAQQPPRPPQSPEVLEQQLAVANQMLAEANGRIESYAANASLMMQELSKEKMTAAALADWWKNYDLGAAREIAKAKAAAAAPSSPSAPRE